MELPSPMPAWNCGRPHAAVLVQVLGPTACMAPSYLQATSINVYAACSGCSWSPCTCHENRSSHSSAHSAQEFADSTSAACRVDSSHRVHMASRLETTSERMSTEHGTASE